MIDYRPQGYGHTLRLRGIRVSLPDGTIETLASNVFDPDITAEMFRGLYFLRWGIESKYSELKEQIQAEAFSGSHPTAIRQDFHISMFLSNLASALKTDADEAVYREQEMHKENKYEYQADRGFLINRVKKYLVRILSGFLDVEKTLIRIVGSAQRVLSQKQPGRTYSRKGNQSRRKYHNNRKPRL